MEKSTKTRPQLVMPNAIDRVVETIVEAKRPQKIVLFGSHAEGKARWDSDMDLLVIMEAEGPPRQCALEIRRLFKKLPCPMDLFVCTPSEVEYWQDLPSSFISHMLKHGVVLYEREPEATDPGMGQ
jgi:predicted nucleotidyltransferase